MFENLLAAFYLSGGGHFEWMPDPKDGYGTAMHLEPRYSLGAGFSFDATDHVEVDLGYEWKAMPPIPGHGSDPLDRSHSLYLQIRYRPFRSH
jgi:opacity protein-like surface antigen